MGCASIHMILTPGAGVLTPHAPQICPTDFGGSNPWLHWKTVATSTQRPSPQSPDLSHGVHVVSLVPHPILGVLAGVEPALPYPVAHLREPPVSQGGIAALDGYPLAGCCCRRLAARRVDLRWRRTRNAPGAVTAAAAARSLASWRRPVDARHRPQARHLQRHRRLLSRSPRPLDAR